MTNKHTIENFESFDIRKPVLEAMLSTRWHINADNEIEFDLPLGNYSHHQRAIIEFSLNPYVISENIFSGLDRHVRQKLATALEQLFGPNGIY